MKSHGKRFRKDREEISMDMMKGIEMRWMGKGSDGIDGRLCSWPHA